MKSKSYIEVIAGLVIMSTMLATSMRANAQNKADSMQKVMEDTSIVKTGDYAPDFSVEMLDGRFLKLSDLKGKVVLLNFWATWCGPCMMEFKEIPDKILKRFEGKSDFVFIPISREETRETVRNKMNQLKKDGIDFPAGIDPDKTIYSLYAKSYIPRNYLIDKNGKVIHVLIGYDAKEFAALADRIEELLK